MWIRLLALLLIATCATPAMADPLEEELHASPGAIATGMIGDADAEGVFEVLGAEHIEVVRHIQSGLVCRWPPENAAQLMLFPGAPRGDDVGCEASDGRETVALYATRTTSATDNAAELSGAIVALRQRYSRAIAYTPQPQARLPGHRPSSATAHFRLTMDDGAHLYSRVSVAVIGNWIIKLRYSRLAESAAEMQDSDRNANIVWVGVLNDFMENRPH